ncbi:MAG TPA: NAD(P)/FAD-dependent oxidoreductase [Thermomicrobiaceae bacterium]|nr:NAD(P)/FAD-dependent oxidoreductase [Thermomicrobiaceae bacterium]
MRHDAIVVGGSFAGLSAATYIARARRSVCIIDSGRPRNRFAGHSHGFLTRDGSEPLAMLATAHSQVAAYPTTTFVEGEAVRATADEDGFTVSLANGEVLESARLVLAYGISDDLPAIPGLAERWGKSVIPCPYCHGFEFSGRRLGVLHISPASIHHAMLIPEWGPTTYFLNGAPLPHDEPLAELRRRGVDLEPAPVKALHGAGTELSCVELEDGRTVPLDALLVVAPTQSNSDIAEQLGCELEEGPFGQIVKTDGMQMTTVPNVFAAGDITRFAHNITRASAGGVMAGTAVHASLVF